MINVGENEILLRCECGSKEHMGFLTYDPITPRGNNLKCENDDWYLGVTLDPIWPWWKRVWIALRPHGKFGIYAELVLKNDDMRKISEFIQGKLQ